ncbi:hypothetical protein [Leptolyngbya sp. BC1307]|nr:hypothetical protein [Leptolyngbya sp. BC1307]
MAHPYKFTIRSLSSLNPIGAIALVQEAAGSPDPVRSRMENSYSPPLK